MAKLIYRISILSLLFLLTGCNEYQELNKLAFVIGMGIDKTDDDEAPYEVTVQIINPSEVSSSSGIISGGKALTTVNIKSKGKTLSEAVRLSAQKASRSLFYAHVALVVINEKAAKESLNEILDVYTREARVSESTPVLIARDSSANEILSIIPTLEKLPTTSIIGKLEASKHNLGRVVISQLYEIVHSLSLKGQEPALTAVSIDGDKQKGEEKVNAESTNTTIVEINGVGLFKDGKLVTWMDGPKSIAINTVLNKVNSANLSVPCGKDSYFSLRMSSIKSKTKTRLDSNFNPTISMTVDASGSIDEALCKLDSKTPEQIKKLEQQSEEKLKATLLEGIKYAQSYKSDVFGFGEMIRRQHNQEWKKINRDWDDYFAKATIDLHVNLVITETNNLSQTITKCGE